MGIAMANAKIFGFRGFSVALFVLIKVVKPKLFKAAQSPAIQ